MTLLHQFHLLYFLSELCCERYLERKLTVMGCDFKRFRFQTGSIKSRLIRFWHSVLASVRISNVQRFAYLQQLRRLRQARQRTRRGANIQR